MKTTTTTMMKTRKKSKTTTDPQVESPAPLPGVAGLSGASVKPT
jgi:hypothetical protein